VHAELAPPAAPPYHEQFDVTSTSRLSLTNHDVKLVDVLIEFFTEDDTQLGDSLFLELAPQGTTIIRVADVEGVPDGYSGYADISASQPISVTVSLGGPVQVRLFLPAVQTP
jgi:hypothetical protein